jgi:uncharacterized membrane protein YfcA
MPELFPTLAVLLAVTIAAVALHAITGFGFALVLTPLLLALRTPAETVSTTLLLGLLANGVIAAERRPAGVHPDTARVLLPAGLLGLPGGAAVLAFLPKTALQIVLGVVVLVAVAIQLRRPAGTSGAEAPRWQVALAGLFSGVLRTAVGLGAAPVVLWMRHVGIPAAAMRWSIAAFFVVLGAVGLGVLVVSAGGEALDGLSLAAVLTPTAILGYVLGRRALAHLQPHHYRAIVLSVIAASGAASIVTGLAGA